MVDSTASHSAAFVPMRTTTASPAAVAPTVADGEQTKIQVKDLLIVSIGDSYA